MINDIQQNYKFIHNHTKIFKQIFIFFHGECPFLKMVDSVLYNY